MRHEEGAVCIGSAQLSGRWQYSRAISRFALSDQENLQNVLTRFVSHSQQSAVSLLVTVISL